MKLSKIVLTAIATLPFLMARGESDTLSHTKATHREFVKNEFLTTYAQNPALMGRWRYFDFANIGTSYKYENGEYRDLQSYNRLSMFSITTESVMRLPKGWSFYGKFAYLNGSSKDTKMNLSYDIDRKGSPYYYIMNMPGDWSFQKYIFEGIATKELIPGFLYAGGSISYKSDLHFRTVDYRNEQYSLNIAVNPSLTLVTKRAGHYTLTLNYSRLKREPDIYTKYQHSNEGDSYMIYINTGLGSYVKNAPVSTTLMSHNYGATISWGYETKKWSTEITYKGALTNEAFNNKMTSSISAFGDHLGKYQLFDNNLSINYLRFINRNTLLKAELTAEMYTGEAKQYVNETSSFNKNYTSDHLSSALKIKIEKISGIVRNLSAGVSFTNQESFDLNYGQKLSYTNLDMELFANFAVATGKNGEITAGAGGGFKTNLDLLHNPLSAIDNLVTQKIIYPKLSYLTAEHYRLDARVQYSRELFKEYCADIELRGGYIKPLSVIYPDPYHTINTKDNYYTIELSLRFNF